jgi:hypothetical protein
MKVEALTSFVTAARAYNLGEVFDLPEGARDWIKAGLVRKAEPEQCEPKSRPRPKKSR